MTDEKKTIASLKDLRNLLDPRGASSNEKLENEGASAHSDSPIPKSPREQLDTSQVRDVEMAAEAVVENNLVEASLREENAAFLQSKLNQVSDREREVANLEISLSLREKKIAASEARAANRKETLDERSRQLKEQKRGLAEKIKRLADVKKAEAQLNRQEKAFAERVARLKKAEQAVKRQQEAAKKLRRNLREAKADVELLNKDLRSSKRRANKLDRELEALKDQASGLDAAQFGLEWLMDNGGQSDKIPWSEVVVIGSGPFDETDLTNFLIDRGVDVYDTNTEGVPCMIVGREGWTEEKLEMQIAAQQGLELRVYSQEMALFALAAGTDMFDVSDQDTLKELAGEHPALALLREGELRWPLFAVPSIPKEFNPELWNIGDVDQSPLKAMGYTVGITEGISRKARKDLLARAYLGSLTSVHSAEYMRDWGRPRTRRRLWRIANHLAWLARARKGNPSQRYAVADWVTDLEMMEKRFFKPWMRFAWPRVKVPGRR